MDSRAIFNARESWAAEATTEKGILVQDTFSGSSISPSGTDLECGSSYKALIESVKKGLISEETVDASVKRLMKARFALGEMDEPEKGLGEAV